MSAAAERKEGQIETSGFARDIPELRDALIRQRKYTLALYADLPPAYWVPAQFPCLSIVNPPLWELAHIAWFAEFFCLRWRSDDVAGRDVPSILTGADDLFNSQTVPHATRWSIRYPDSQTCRGYMQQSLDAVVDALDKSEPGGRYGFQLAIAHEDMHAEALAMTLVTLGLPLPRCVPARGPIAGACHDLNFDGGKIERGASSRSFRFDNEMPACPQDMAPFSIASQPVSASAYREFVESPDYVDDRLWSEQGREWRQRSDPGSPARPVRSGDHADLAAMHVNYFQAEAWCRWAGRRLPSEAEWEFAATRSAEFWNSAGQVWEWCASVFAPYPGFVPARYRDYSEPWFHTHQVLRGGSFVTNHRLKYPQYRNFYTKDRSDMFCGFRTCALV